MTFDHRVDAIQTGWRDLAGGTPVSPSHSKGKGGVYRKNDKNWQGNTKRICSPASRSRAKVRYRPWLRGEICSKIALCLHPERQFHGTGVSQKIKRQDAAPQLGRRQNLDQLGRGTFGEIRIRRAAHKEFGSQTASAQNYLQADWFYSRSLHATFWSVMVGSNYDSNLGLAIRYCIWGSSFTRLCRLLKAVHSRAQCLSC